MEIGLVNKIDIDHEMQQAYLDYAMSVIVSRALPDVRDGLKPVHRRILYAMYDMGVRPDLPYRKSARIVGEVLGKYHPHGDMAVYEAMARMAQSFSMRYPLIDGQGNFGSVDGDPPAAMRYTEARLAETAMQMLADIGKNTVDFVNNFDGALTEPTVLPSALPNLLINGATGIAVGMATSIPPHNLGEIVDAMQFLLSKWEDLDEVGIEDLMRFVKGPDFPTGGVLVHPANGDSLVSAYSTGRGRVAVQARAHLEEMERGRSRIIVTELPYMTNKSSLIERIAELAREEKLEGIADLRDESDRQGMRIVIELSKTANPETVLSNLLRLTPMQVTFSLNMLALVDGEPRLLSLKQAMRYYLEHRLEIVRRRSEYDLEKARQRAHILEGLRVALKNLDEVIEIIRKSPDVDTARNRLMKRFKLSQVQTQAILDMPLRRLAALERKKIEEEYKETLAAIKELEALLRSPKKMRQVVSSELQMAKETFGDRRRTHIVQLKEGQSAASMMTAAETIPDKDVWISVTNEGLISRSLEDSLPRQSGREAPAWLVRANTRDTLYLVCEQGEAAATPVHALPETSNPLEGAPIHKATPLRENHRLAAAIAVPARNGQDQSDKPPEKRFLISVTRQGMIKKTNLDELPGPSASVFTVARVNEGDQIAWLRLSNGDNELLLVTAAGAAIRFSEEEVRPMGLVAAGVMGIKLAANDEVAGMELLPAAGDVFFISNTGRAKRVKIDQFPLQGRYGQGVQAWKLDANERVVGIAVGKGSDRVTLHFNRLLPKAIRLDEAPLQTRAARGQIILELKPGDAVIRVSAPLEAFQRLPTKPSTGKKAGAVKKSSTRAGTTKAKAAPQQTPQAKKPAAPKESATTKSTQVKTRAEKIQPATPQGEKVVKAKSTRKIKAGSAESPSAAPTATPKPAGRKASAPPPASKTPASKKPPISSARQSPTPTPTTHSGKKSRSRPISSDAKSTASTEDSSPSSPAAKKKPSEK